MLVHRLMVEHRLRCCHGLCGSVSGLWTRAVYHAEKMQEHPLCVSDSYMRLNMSCPDASLTASILAAREGDSGQIRTQVYNGGRLAYPHTS
jgi:hypothetical protein